MEKNSKHKKAQVWIETVIYTLIALTIIGIVLSVVKPRIEESQDNAIIEQSIKVIKNIDSIILDISRAPGNQRIIELGVKKGSFNIDGAGDRIIFQIDSRSEYSEPGREINDSSGITIYTEKLGRTNNVTLTKIYNEYYDLRYDGEDKTKSITKSAASYRLLVTNKGENGGKTVIDIKII